MTANPRPRRLARALCAAAALSAIGIAGLSAPLGAQAAGDEPAATVKWAGGNDASVQQHQVDHAGLLSDGKGNDAGSGHWDDFKNLEVSVSKTTNLGDEAVTVTASGMAGTKYQDWPGSASNYLQIFQCWGPDPLAADFAETCQFGAWSSNTGNTKAGAAMGVLVGWAASGRDSLVDVAANTPFRAVTGEQNVRTELDIGGSKAWVNGLLSFFDTSTSNEQPFVAVSAEGTASVKIETQSAAAQPYLGCGRPKPSGVGSRCWLVVVPRGTHSGELTAGQDLKCATAGWGGRPFGETTASQLGGPVDQNCSYWQDRITVPLDFADTSSSCAAGAAEMRVVGSELLSNAMSSWQPGLCSSSGNAYTLTTGSGDVTRNQLLTGVAKLSVVANPLTATSIGSADPALLQAAKIGYAPVANTGLVIGYVADDTTQSYTTLKLTPRLLAKSLTQSYDMDIPWVAAQYDRTDVDRYWPHRASSLPHDPEWIALGNPAQQGLSPSRGVFVVSGPQGEDTVRLLWQYIQSDADAVAFLKGDADPWGNTINPYYLPATNPTAKGGGLPFDLATQPIDSFLKADQTLAPGSAAEADEKYRGQRIDSLTMEPYSSSLAANASRVFRTDPRYTQEWDPFKPVGTSNGAWVAYSPQLASRSRLTLGPMDAASADRYGLSSMQLGLPLATTTAQADTATARAFVGPSDASMSAAVSAMTVDPATGIGRPDFSALPVDAYPLTATLYAAVNLNSTTLDGASREKLAVLLDYSAGPGNLRGAAAGQLPPGYVPLTATQIAATAQLATALRTPAQPEQGTAPGGAKTTPAGAPAAVTSPPQNPPTQTTVSANGAPATADTASTAIPVQSLLPGASLLTGIGGLAAAPFLLRRKGAAG
ncbi:hypothetical protein [Luethyella okanaganae]|uniref:PBP domain-containing protein n=1 Tax=Luethyella okanaganae TaxID=69372 RepID=A0ABW1VGC2_9MICO